MMRREVYQYIRSKPELHQFLRYNPYWYRRLSRYPEKVYEMEKEAKLFLGKTFPQRMNRLQENMSLAMAMVEMMRQFQSKD